MEDPPSGELCERGAKLNKTVNGECIVIIILLKLRAFVKSLEMPDLGPTEELKLYSFTLVLRLNKILIDILLNSVSKFRLFYIVSFLLEIPFPQI